MGLRQNLLSFRSVTLRHAAVAAAVVGLTLGSGPASAAVIALQCQSKTGRIVRIDIDTENRVLKEVTEADSSVFRDGVVDQNAAPGCVDFVNVSPTEFAWGLKCPGYTIDEKIDRRTGQYVRLFLGPVYAACSRASTQPRF